MKIEIICTGDEILTGKTVNTNYSHIARRLQEFGFDLHWGTIVGDDRASLVKAFNQAADRSDHVIVNGGLGPTVDDLSQEVAADAAGVDLELHQHWLDHIAVWYKSRGRVMPENNQKQAMLPSGSEFIDNPIGTACGFALDIGGARFYFTPGVPREMKRMLEEQILPRLQAARGIEVQTRVKRFHTFGIGESRADRMLDGIEEMSPNGDVKLGFQSHFPQLETKLTARGTNPKELEEKLAPLEDAIRERLGSFILAEDDESLEGNIYAVLRKQGGTLCAMEGITGGDVIARLSANRAMAGMLKESLVSQGQPDRLAGDGNKILELAQEYRHTTGASHSLVVFGEFSESEKGREPFGDVCIAVAGPEHSELRKSRLPGSAPWVRIAATELALDTLRRYLQGLPVGEKIDFEQQ